MCMVGIVMPSVHKLIQERLLRKMSQSDFRVCRLRNCEAASECCLFGSAVGWDAALQV